MLAAFAVLLLATTALASPALVKSVPHSGVHGVHGVHSAVHEVHHQTTPVHHQQGFARHGGFEQAIKSHVTHQVAAKHHHDDVGVTAKHHFDSADKPYVRITSQDMEVNPDGSFHNVWSSENGISVQEQGVIKHVGDHDVAVQNGEISYTDNEGHQYYLKYVADENGFQPQGDHLPTPPPVPLGIARGLEFIAAHPYVETTTHGSQHNYRPGQYSPVVIDN